MSTTGERPPLRRQGVIDAARGLIAEEGLSRLTLRHLADAVGVTAAALYAHFADKDDLLRAVAEQEFDELSRQFESIDRDFADGPPIERIRAHCRHYVQKARTEPELFRVMFLFPPDFGEIGTIPPGLELPAATRALDLGLDAVRDAIDRGDIEADDPLMPAMALWAGAHGVANIFLLDYGIPAEFADAFIDEVTDRTLRGYGAQVGASST